MKKRKDYYVLTPSGAILSQGLSVESACRRFKEQNKGVEAFAVIPKDMVFQP